jgi:hypothetical protein
VKQNTDRGRLHSCKYIYHRRRKIYSLDPIDSSTGLVWDVAAVIDDQHVLRPPPHT